jgi:nicotinamidase-related amidase
MKKALLLIDIQNDYFEGGSNPLEGSQEASKNAKAILEQLRKDGDLVVHIQHISRRAGSTFFLPETYGAEIHSNVKPLEGELVIEKHYPNSFRETNLLDILINEGVEELVICGMMTHMCVDATVRAAKDFGFETFVVGDACATKKLVYGNTSVSAASVHASFLAALSYYYARVVSCETYLLEIRS